MRTPSKIITALALAGLAVAGGAAFTGQGMAMTDSPAESMSFIGGEVDAAVTGGVLEDVKYAYTVIGSGSPEVTYQTIISGVTLTFDEATLAGSKVTVHQNVTAGTANTQWDTPQAVAGTTPSVTFSGGTTLQELASLDVIVQSATT